MADKTTLQETAAAALDGTEAVRAVQAGGNVKTLLSDIKTWVLSATGLVAATTPANADVMRYLNQGGTDKTVTLAILKAFFVSATGIAAATAPADADILRYLSQGGTDKTVTLALLKAYMQSGAYDVSRDGMLSAAGGTNVMSVTAGVRSDSTGTELMSGAAASKTLAAWALGSGNGGLDTSTAAINTTYHKYMIKRPDTGVVEYCFSLSAVAPTFGSNIPAAYTKFRRLGACRTDGSGFFPKFTQVGGKRFVFDAPQTIATGLALSTTAQLVDTKVPTGVPMRAAFNAGMFTPTTASQVLITPPVMAAQAANSPGGNYNLITGGAGGSFGGGFNMDTNTSGQLRVVASSSDAQLYAYTQGWEDFTL